MKARTVPVDWALWSKPSGSSLDYHIVRASRGEDSYPFFTRLILPLLPGSPDRAASGTGCYPHLPWVTFRVEPVPIDGTRAVGVCVTSKATELDHAGRRLSRSLFYRFPLDAVEEGHAGFTALWRTVKSTPLPQKAEPLHLEIARQPWDEIASEIEHDGTFDWYAVAAAALLEQPVAITAGTSLGPDRAAVVLDAVIGLLPYGFRSSTTAGTGVDSMTHHQLRLVFASHAQQGALEIPYTEDGGHEDAEIGLGVVGRSFLQELRALRNDLGGSVRKVLETMAALTDPHAFGSADAQSNWAVTVLRERNPVRGVLHDITDERGRVRRSHDGSLDPSTASPRNQEEAERLLAAGPIPSDQRSMLYEYLARGPFPELLPPKSWPDALDVITGVVHGGLAASAAAEEQRGDPSPPELSAARFAAKVAARFIEAAPPGLRDELISRFADATGSLAALASPEQADALLTGLGREIPSWIGSSEHEDLPGTRESLSAQPELVYRILEQNVDNPPGMRLLLRLLNGATSSKPWLSHLAALLTAAPDSPAPDVRAEEVIDADTTRPGVAELLLMSAWALDRVDIVLPVLWPALLRGAAGAGPRASLSRQVLRGLRARYRSDPPGERLDARIDVLLLLAGEDRTESLALAARLDPAGLDPNYVDGLNALWNEPAAEPLRGLISARVVEGVITSAGLLSDGSGSGPGTVFTAVRQLLEVFEDPASDELVDVLVRSRQAGSFDLDDLPESFWAGIGDRRRDLTDEHWTTMLRRVSGTGVAKPIAELWPRLVQAGFAPRELLAALGPWPRVGALRRVFAGLPTGSRLLGGWSARVDQLIDSVELPTGFSQEERDLHREELRSLLRSGAWGNQAAEALRAHRGEQIRAK